MSRTFKPKVVTANALIEGDVVYLTADDRWTRTHAEAELITTEERAAIRLSFGEAQDGIVVGVYLADAIASENGPQPIHFREEFRAVGPSNYNHGKQAEQANV
ncbi:DUF2849 domain-containing protein [Cochlodiniinecator piscidefendens]|uniref:DUF2849 domain-containing protein n=1 Tax=Cochlodiniinecator piscidefendens TaxID=2715756 RepID=UPI00140CB120|nr:DUF2849 domain-containing protein [Cochlodiniinecator piscidefendens]